MGALLDNVGFTHAQEGPLNVITDVAVRFMEKLCKEVKLAGEYCESFLHIENLLNIWLIKGLSSCCIVLIGWLSLLILSFFSLVQAWNCACV